MAATTLQLPDELRQRAEDAAHRRGVSFDEFVCDTLKNALNQPQCETDPLWADKAVFEGDVPADLSLEHDRYLYGEGS